MAKSTLDRLTQVQVYLSHSYRPEDRAINMAVWQRLNAAGLVFAVDPPDPAGARPMDVTFIERMMQRCGAFVAIVPDRSLAQSDDAGAAADKSWSPYQALECRLALRADKPRLLVLEQNMARGPLPDTEAVLAFERSGRALSSDFERQLQALVERAGVLQHAPMPKVGLLRWRPGSGPWNALVERMRDAFNDDGNENCGIVDVDERSPDHGLLSRARRYGMVVADLNPAVTPPHVIGLLHGAAIPLYRLCLLQAAGTEAEWMVALGLERGAASNPNAPRLLHGYRVDAHMQPVRFWLAADVEATAQAVVATVRGYQQRERRLETKDSAREYFLGLRGNRVFISTPGPLVELSARLKEDLDDAGMPSFHYKRSPLEGGMPWKEQLERRIHNADLLLGLVTPDYWDRPECVDELESAVRRWERHQMMIVLYRGGGSPPPALPAFLGRYQVNTIGDLEGTRAQVVADLRARFADRAREAPMALIERLALMVDRQLPLADPARLAQALVRHCALDEAAAARACARLEGVQRPAQKLVRILLGAIHEESYGGDALARLCLYLRAHQPDPADRAWLSRQFSELRLLPNLHRLADWNARRVRKEVGIRLLPGASARLLGLTSRAVGQTPDPLPLVRALGSELASQLAVDDTAGLLAERETRVRIDCEVDDLMVPVEWATLAGLPAALALARPAYRRVATIAPLSQRETLEQHFGNNAGGPPRVLMFGAPTPQLPQVATELLALRHRLKARYTGWEWPADPLLHCVADEQATREQLQWLVERSDFDVLHLAGHAGLVGERPVFEVAGPDGTREQVGGDELAGWLRDSSVRFVYLSCCEGAATPLSLARAAGWQKSLCKLLLEAGVAEVLAFFWPIDDTDAPAFTSSFYEHFFPRFDAPAALLAARLAGGHDSPLWAASLLVQQMPAQAR